VAIVVAWVVVAVEGDRPPPMDRSASGTGLAAQSHFRPGWQLVPDPDALRSIDGGLFHSSH